MKKYLTLILAVMFVAGMSHIAVAGEHGGSEHGGKTHAQEHGGAAKAAVAAKAPSNSDIRNTMSSYVTEKSKATGTFDIKDPDTGKMLNLKMLRVHERVGKTGDYYYSCADFQDAKTGTLYDLDLDVSAKGGNLKVADVRVHKESGEPRYTYDDNDNRIPLVAGTKSHMGVGGSKGSAMGGSMKGSPMGGGSEHGGSEHGGKEHGG